MAIFDGLINWWDFDACAKALSDTGSFPGSSFPFEDRIDEVSNFITPHDGAYVQGSVARSPGNDVNGFALEALTPPWQCAEGHEGIWQRIPTMDYLHPAIDPQTGGFGNNIGIAPIPGGGLWFDPRDGWTFVIWGFQFLGYYIKRVSFNQRQYLVGSHLTTGTSDRGWDIVADLDAVPLVLDVDPGTVQLSDGSVVAFTLDGLSTLVDKKFPDSITGTFKFVMVNDGSHFNVRIGPVEDSDYHMLAVTYDPVSELLSTYFDGSLVTARPTSTGELHFGGTAYHWGARYNLGSDDNGFTSPWNGGWASTLQWNRALTADEISQIQSACDARARLHSRFYAVNSDSHNRFARARKIRGASGQTVPFDPAGHDVEASEPKGANVVGSHQTAWYKWTAPSSGPVTFHTAEGHPADNWSSAPEHLRPGT